MRFYHFQRSRPSAARGPACWQTGTLALPLALRESPPKTRKLASRDEFLMMSLFNGNLSSCNIRTKVLGVYFYAKCRFSIVSGGLFVINGNTYG